MFKPNHININISVRLVARSTDQPQLCGGKRRRVPGRHLVAPDTCSGL
jgi:hypothetical protein